MQFSPRLVPKSKRRHRWHRWPAILRPALAAALVLFCLPGICPAQQFTKAQRKLAEDMLHEVSQDVKQHYFDPLALGSDWNQQVRITQQKIDASRSMNEALAHIAALLDSLEDSHTYFLPPQRPYRHDYGFQMEMVGERCLVTRVRPGSDAEQKGLHAGDQILTLDGYAPTRGDIWRMHSVFWILQPQQSLQLGIRTVAGSVRQVKVSARVRQFATAPDPVGSAMFDAMRERETRQNRMRPALAQHGNALLVVKLPNLNLSESQVNAVLARMRKHEAVILDLRGNPGGSEEALRNLLGGMFQKPIPIGTLVSSRSTSTLSTKPQRHPFTGKLAVLIDSQTGSAAELFARVIQLEKRGLVMGDVSAGRAGAAQQYMHQEGIDPAIVYGAIVTTAEIRMADGQTVERNSVTPDKLALPTPEDLANGRDPAMAAAGEALHLALTPAAAGALFPSRWPAD